MVEVIKTLSHFLSRRQEINGPIGFVPTMGNLHEGHISLLQKGLEEFETVIFSIFVNPKQFGPNEDFHKYPRTLEQDIQKIEDCLKTHPGKRVIVFAPQDPAEVFAQKSSLVISVAGIKDILEGEIRPGHFDGVSTVVYRLFEIVRPNRAYFGLKDYQQYLVIKKMVKDLVLPVDIVGMPIIREPSGLALSSRNQYLSPEEKIEGLKLSQGLRQIAAMIAHKKENLPKALKAIDELLQDKKWNYLEIRDAETLSKDLSRANKIVLLAVYQLRTTRLLDNLEVSLA